MVSVVNTGHWAQKAKSVIPGGMNEVQLKPSAPRVSLDACPILTGSQSGGDTECNHPNIHHRLVRMSSCYNMGLIPFKQGKN